MIWAAADLPRMGGTRVGRGHSSDVTQLLAAGHGSSCQCRTKGENELGSRELKRAEAAISAIIAEYQRATELHGPMTNAWHGESVLRGELNELSAEVHGHRPDRAEAMREEAVQVGAMALRFLVDVCGVEEHTPRDERSGQGCPTIQRPR